MPFYIILLEYPFFLPKFALKSLMSNPKAVNTSFYKTSLNHETFCILLFVVINAIFHRCH